MKALFTKRALKDYNAFPSKLQALIDKQLEFLLKDIRYTSLRVKKYDERRGVWQIRISQSHRLYFRIEGDTYVIITIMKHPK
jgi:mRNA-degrading endonuclease RelE of RelBE toxin-antitoxin system